MKKLYTQAKWKKQSQIRSRRELKRRRIDRNFGDPPSPKNQLASLFLTPRQPDKILRLPVPENFSFINKPNDLLHFLQLAKQLIADRNVLFFDKSDVKTMTSDAIALFVAHLGEKSFHRYMPFKGNNPKDPDLLKLFVESGFYNYVKSKIPKN